MQPPRKGLREYAIVARPILHAALLLFAITYVLLIPLGVIGKDNRWGTEEVVLLGLLVLFSSRLVESVTDLTIGKEGVVAKFRQLEDRQREQQEQLSYQKAQIRSLQVALQGIVSQYEFDKLVGLAREEPFLCYYSNDLYEEMKRLRAMGLVLHHAGTGLGDMRAHYKDKPQQFDLKRFFYITKLGQEYMALRRELETEDAASGP
jgi:hypothetical protein